MNFIQAPVLDPEQPGQSFPLVHTALKEPNGLLAIGGCLSPQRIINAYQHGIFPWFNPESPILWWSPDPRMVLYPEKFNISRSLRKKIRKQHYSVSFDQAFAQVVSLCAAPRKNEPGTWITHEMQQAYNKLFQLGVAHSVETWEGDQLVGGLYGIAIGQVFYGESMFFTKTDASKVAFAVLVDALIRWRYQLIDCQVQSQHLQSLGAEEIERTEFIQLLTVYCNRAPSAFAWQNYE